MLEKSIKAEARKLGFELAGITTPDPPPHFGVFERWLESGRHGDMDYLATQRSLQRRSDPRRILPECKSILVLGIRYANPESTPSPRQAESPCQREPDADWQPFDREQPTTEARPVPYGRVASYAWGEDYHHALLPRLQALVDFIEAKVGRSIPNRFYTDTGPLLERDLAQRAGLGWIGKNTCLINPRSGSYFLLAEILLGLELT
ncbi:MAG: DUF1730 domain-containing protein, partial [Anaerolineales bacterium]|nr:DUF1730 domain-containing protein [Anaerolineales bacterium]